MASVLVIDDDPAVRGTVCRVLKLAGHETTEVENGKDGLDAVIRNRYDLVITDLIMPEQEGIETIERLRELDPSLPILAISGAGGGGFSPLDDATMMGADAVLEKPFTVEQLREAVERLLG